MNRKIIGYSVSSFGLGILASAIIYPLGYLESEDVYHGMILIGSIFIVIGLFIRPTDKKQVVKEKNQ